MKNLTKVLCIALLLSPGFVLAADTLKFSASDDAYVDESMPNTNYGSSPMLSTQGTIRDPYYGFTVADGQPESVRQSYLQFDVNKVLTDIPAGATIESVVFGVYLYDIAANSAVPSVDLFYANDNWDESTVTWNTAPDEVGDTLGTQMYHGSDVYYEWDLLNNSEVSWVDTDVWHDGVVSFLLAPTDDEFWNGTILNSREAQSNQPYLNVTYSYSVVPAPGSITLAVLGMSSVAAIRRKRRGL